MNETDKILEVAPPRETSPVRTSPTIDKIAAALCDAQAEMKNPITDATANATATREYKYATLARVIDAAKPLHKHGIAYCQIPTRLDGKPIIVTRLMHKSGEWIEGDCEIVAMGQGNQAFGSAMTYMRRYALAAILGMAADEDDDGSAGDGNAKDLKQEKDGDRTRGAKAKVQAAAAQTNGKTDHPGANKNQLRQLAMLFGDEVLKIKLREHRLAYVSEILNKQIASTTDLTFDEAQRCINTINDRIAALRDDEDAKERDHQGVTADETFA